MRKRTAVRTALRAVATGTSATALLGLTPHLALAAPAPVPRTPAASLTAAHAAATAPAALDTVARFFAAERERGGARTGGPGAVRAAPRVEGAVVPVYVLSPDFVRGREGAPVARLAFLAGRAVAGDGRTASVRIARRGAAWKIVRIAAGDDETRYSAAGAARAKGGTVFREPGTDAWYVQRGDRVEPLDAEARQAVGAHGTTVAAYRERVARAYGDKLPGTAYDRRGAAGGYGPVAGAGTATGAGARQPHAPRPVTTAGLADDSLPVTAATTLAGAAALLALALSASAPLRRRRSG
ncbi:hypothetical protein AB0G60_29210 [Streptomyces angustmyceticus]|uniref:Gram-positive cocci surface proteins LPxTG domain-containing protein n=1 Tax=Streptomyces angustmyceticus TaxID=285578 RepID=A0A5J4LKZ9_9ACTN|nr:hypothetical protein [Streptomyces angustmyceticus]UAL69784.1 hypothetical protein K7396_27200 [Streptomyces angustmyceticus]GES32651.1 hypothetical protein San01_51390 [Streptomyces angustmyceticus]